MVISEMRRTKETRYPNGSWYPGLDLGTERILVEKLEKTE